MLIDKAPEGSQSPNLADSAMMLFAPQKPPMKINPNLLADREHVA
jgi:hypothetical protein